ncbi:aldo/keto reductase [Azospirillum canadense]|uniref:aldo/keto reductase n=1 Tax=Azospirillum canadense TaxID=403962 RepID=UPI002226684E|nr:aldo/keto reductase [Azospirillum canadense]MCW2242364.1 putative dehydrogenase/aryl-alcohol dehydrogenase-like putative oxidoreductase [Azospirillum canadense]
MTASPSLRWGILGTGAIARQFADALVTSTHGRLVAVASRQPTSELAQAFGGAIVHAGYGALLADSAVDAVYIATPHPTHAEWAIRACEAGKHVLCEKPLGMNAAEAMAVADAAARAGVVVMEAFMYRGHPQTRRLLELIASGVIGDVTMIQAAYGYHTDFAADKRHFDPALGGGAILDVGCYGVSMCRLIAGVAAGKPFAEPVEIQAQGHLGSTGVDERSTAVLRFPGGLLAQVAASITTVQDNGLRIYGTKGRIEVRSPWFCSGKTGGVGTITLTSRAGAVEVIEVETTEWLYALEADLFAKAVAAGVIPWPAPSLPDSIGTMQALDTWRQAIGLDYPCERPGRPQTVAGRPLRRAPDTDMPYDDHLGLGKLASRIVTGGMALKTYPLAATVYDAFFEAGGTMFDTAYVYGQGNVDRLLGQWLRSRGVREEVVIIGKGAHTPHCTPDAIRPQLFETLDRLGTDYVDLYFMHRDDPSVPVGEFVDVLDALVREGRIRKFGGSNWTIARMDEANAYAARHGKRGFELLSNNFSLAEIVEPMWEGCIASSDDDSVDWLRHTQIPLFAWSSQARGFFTDRAGRDKFDDPVMAKCWYSETNFQRRDRVHALAAKLGVTPAQVALACLLVQPHPIFPIIGPATLAELRDSLGALRTRLTPEDAVWLKTGHTEERHHG